MRTLPNLLVGLALAALLAPSASATDKQVVQGAKKTAASLAADHRKISKGVLNQLNVDLKSTNLAFALGDLTAEQAADQAVDLLSQALTEVLDEARQALQLYDDSTQTLVEVLNEGSVPESLRGGECGPSDKLVNDLNKSLDRFHKGLQKVIGRRVKDADYEDVRAMPLRPSVDSAPKFESGQSPTSKGVESLFVFNQGAQVKALLRIDRELLERLDLAFVDSDGEFEFVSPDDVTIVFGVNCVASVRIANPPEGELTLILLDPSAPTSPPVVVVPVP
jgi:hypothetical protein